MADVLSIEVALYTFRLFLNAKQDANGGSAQGSLIASRRGACHLALEAGVE